MPRDPWEDDPDYPVEDWQAQVANGDTRNGYLAWIETKKEQEGDNG